MNSSQKRLAVFCGSRVGNNPAYALAAKQLAAVMVSEGFDLVYGGGKIGLMGIVADEVLMLGGKVYGVIPSKLQSMEVGHDGLTELHIVDTMHERKAMMAQMSDGFIAMAGGIGTLEEIIEVFTWQQIGYHDKPCAFLNTLNYYDPLFGLLQQMVKQNFLDQDQYKRLIIEHTAESLIKNLSTSL